ncbi:MAG: BTAD domain-containing putative transcriptional regulator [Burkholderiales bacterium]
MPKSRPAKVTRPRLHHAIAREHLHARLDEALAHGAVWLSAPPGAGKTTGVAGYLDQRELAGIWYQIDTGDEDPASFFHYLRVAALHGPRAARAASLPLLTAEFLWDIAGFARRFFRQLFDILGPGAILVLDNIQEISATGVVHQTLVEAVESLPGDCRLVAISRVAPPPLYARLLANERLRRLEADAVQYTMDESALIATARIPTLTPAETRVLHERCQGWAAGLTLLLEQVSRGERVADVFQPENLQAVFDYLASQVYARASAEDQRTLLDLCWLPRIPSVALHALCPDPGAGRLLDQLYRGHLFTHRRPAAPGSTEAGTDVSRGYVYQFHALFQSFLRERARATQPPEAIRATQRRSAVSLARLGDVEDAFDLFVDAEDWEGAEALLVAQAPALLASGRWKTVLSWADAMPRTRVDANPEVMFWEGLARSAAMPVEARPLLENAYRTARTAGNARISLFAAAAMIDTYLLEYTNFLGIDDWIDSVIEPLQSDMRPREDGDLETWLHAAALNAMTFRRSAHPYREACVERMMQLVPTVRDANVGMGAIGALLLHAGLTGRVLLARRVERLLPALESAPDLRPHVVAVTQFALAFTYHIDQLRDRSRIEGCLAILDRIAEEDGLAYVRCFSDMMRYMLACHFGTEQQSLDAVHGLVPHAASGRPFDVGSTHMGYAWHAVGARDAETAIRHARPLIDSWMKTGSLYHGIFSLIPLIWGLRRLGQTDAFEAQFERFSQLGAEAGMPVLEAGRLALATVRAMDHGNDAEADRALAALMSLVAEHGCMYAVWLVPDLFVVLMMRAIRKGIEAGLAEEYLRKCTGWAFHPSSHDDEDWPWRVRIRSFGEFAVEVGGKPVAFAPKAPRRVLSLLKCIVAHGAKGVGQNWLVENLWPDDEGDKAHGALRTALHRLRGLLGDPRALIVSDSRVSLDPALVWVDLFAFDRLGSPSGGQVLDRAFALYRGPFLPDDLDEPWAAVTRQRCQRQLEHAVRVVAQGHEDRGDWVEALECYTRALSRDETAESFHRGRMRCLAHLGREADALAAYAQLRRLLAVRLGAAPSSETAELAEHIRSSRPAAPSAASPGD